MRVKGFPAISATFDKRYEALKWSQDKEVEFRLNKNSSFTAKNGKRTLGELIDRYSSINSPHGSGYRVVTVVFTKS